jgi:hypothetical protein
MGAVASATDCAAMPSHIAPPTAVHMMVLCVCMQPFGLPVVPEV